MKKVLSAIVAALVAVSFAGIVCAAEPAKEGALPAGHPPINKEEKAPAKKVKKAKKAKKPKAEVKKQEAPAAAPAVPAAPAEKK